MADILRQKFLQAIETANQAHFSGWDFSWLNGRLIEADPPWHYPQLVRDALPGCQSLLDMGTGGGEFLASLMPLPANTHATESYPPNIPIARQRLEPLGVTVHATEDTLALPFQANYFDLIINRHESFHAAELARILKPGGRFITQQVGGRDNFALNQALQEKPAYQYPDETLENHTNALKNAGLIIDQSTEALLQHDFLDFAAIIYYLKVISWQIEDFSVEKYESRLYDLFLSMEESGVFHAQADRHLIIAHKAPDFE